MMRSKTIRFAGNKALKIYGHLNCVSGKRMKKSNRVFFSSEREALKMGFRPCAKCMESAYKVWKETRDSAIIGLKRIKVKTNFESLKNE
jgi:methylphosphotriester-DNA--protein-cysteine methyltransferase